MKWSIFLRKRDLNGFTLATLTVVLLPNHELGFDGFGCSSHHIASKKAWWILIIHLWKRSLWPRFHAPFVAAVGCKKDNTRHSHTQNQMLVDVGHIFFITISSPPLSHNWFPSSQVSQDLVQVPKLVAIDWSPMGQKSFSRGCQHISNISMKSGWTKGFISIANQIRCNVHCTLQ